MSTIKSSAENLTLNADGANNDIKFQSNGSEVASIDQAGSLVLSGNLTSVGIDDNADALAITIDSSENVLVGTTSAFGSSGITLGSNVVYSAGSSQNVANFQRYGSDGEIIRLGKAGTTVGSIGVLNSNNLTISGTVADHGGLQFGTHAVLPMEANADSNGTVDLGASGSRFKDAYLSGGVVFGPASASNVSSQTLDSYEEGTWSPAVVGGTQSVSVEKVTYTKIGRLVTLNVYVGATSVSDSTSFVLSGLPFAAPSNGYNATGVCQTATAANTTTIMARTRSSTSNLDFYYSGSQVGVPQSGFHNHLIFSITYATS